MPVDPPSAPSIAARDLIAALTGVAGKPWSYHAVGTAGGEGGAVVTRVVATDANGSQHHLDVTIGHAAR